MPNTVTLDVDTLPFNVLSIFVVAWQLYNGAKSSLQWLYPVLPHSVRRRLPTLNATPATMQYPPPTATVYKIQYIEPLPLISDPINYYPPSVTSVYPVDEWDLPSWTSYYGSLISWRPMIAGDALCFYTVAMSLVMVRLFYVPLSCVEYRVHTAL